jgi:hypothetical protein
MVNAVFEKVNSPSVAPKEHVKDATDRQQRSYSDFLNVSLELCRQSCLSIIREAINDGKRILTKSLQAHSGNTKSIGAVTLRVTIEKVDANGSLLEAMFCQDVEDRLQLVFYTPVNTKSENEDHRRIAERVTKGYCSERELIALRLAYQISSFARDDLHQLDGYICKARGVERSAPWANIYKPDLFSYAICKSFARLNIDNDINGLWAHASSRKISEDIKNLYQKINAEARKSGLVPSTIYSNESSSIDDDNDGLKVVSRELSAIYGRSAHLFNVDNSFDSNLSSTPVTQEKIDFFSAIEKSYPGILIGENSKRIIEESQAEFTHGKSSNSKSAIIKRLLEVVASHPRLLKEVRYEIFRLIPKFQDIADVDGTILTDINHPNRLFIESIASQAIRFTSIETPGYSEFIQSLRLSIDSYVNSRETYMDKIPFLYSWMNTEWSRISPIQTEKNLLDQRVFENANQRNMQSHMVRNELKYLFKNSTNTPAFVAAFIASPWANIIANIELGLSKTNFRRENAIEVLTNLLWCTNLQNVKAKRIKLISVVPKILDGVKRGFDSIGVGRKNPDYTNFVNNFIAYSRALLSYSKGRPLLPEDTRLLNLDNKNEVGRFGVDIDSMVWLTTQEQNSIEKLAIEHDRSTEWIDFLGMNLTIGLASFDSKFLQGQTQEPADSRLDNFNPAEDLRVGYWFDINVDGARQRIKLKWTNGRPPVAPTMFMFVKESGDTLSMTSRQIERMQSQGSIEVVLRGGILVEAMERLINNG